MCCTLHAAPRPRLCPLCSRETAFTVYKRGTRDGGGGGEGTLCTQWLAILIDIVHSGGGAAWGKGRGERKAAFPPLASCVQAESFYRANTHTSPPPPPPKRRAHFFFKCCNCTHADGGEEEKSNPPLPPPLFLHYLFWGNELTFPGEGEKESWCAHFHFFFAPPSELCCFSFSPRESIRAAQTPSLPTLQGNVCQKKGRLSEGERKGRKNSSF